MVELINVQNAIHLFFKNPLSLVSCTKIFAAYINFESLPHILSSIICVSYLNVWWMPNYLTRTGPGDVWTIVSY